MSAQGHLEELPRPDTDDIPLAMPTVSWLSLDELDQRPCPRALVEGVLPASALAVLYGPPGCGKSFLGLDLALTVAGGCPSWHERRIEHGAVAYAALEGLSGLQHRIRAFEQHLAKDISAMRQRFRLTSGPIDLYQPESFEILLASISEFPEPPRLIIVDTLARAIAYADENSARDVGAMVSNLDRLRQETDAAVLLIHHSGKDQGRGARGSSALLGAVDVALRVSGSKGTIRLSADKVRDGAPFDPLEFRLRTVPIQMTDGSSSTSAVLEATMEEAGTRQLILNRLGSLQPDEWTTIGEITADTRGHDASRQAFNQAAKRLEKKGHVELGEKGSGGIRFTAAGRALYG